MKCTFLAALVLFASPALAQTPTAPVTIVTDKRTYKDATVTHVEADGIDIRFAGGMAHVLFRELPAALQKQYGYNPEAAARAEAADNAQQTALANAAASEARRADYNQKRAKYAQQREDAVKAMKPVKMSIRASQTIDGGVLAYRLGDDESEPIAVFGLEGVDGAVKHNALLYDAGTFSYSTVMGAGKKVHAYATSADEALRRQGL